MFMFPVPKTVAESAKFLLEQPDGEPLRKAMGEDVLKNYMVPLLADYELFKDDPNAEAECYMNVY